MTLLFSQALKRLAKKEDLSQTFTLSEVQVVVKESLPETLDDNH